MELSEPLKSCWLYTSTEVVQALTMLARLAFSSFVASMTAPLEGN